MEDWRLAEEESPKKNKLILIQGACGGMYVGKYFSEKLGYRIWSDLEGYKRIGCVAWMPLPKPYKKGGSHETN